jgi:hypothetical protein
MPLSMTHPSDYSTSPSYYSPHCWTLTESIFLAPNSSVLFLFDPSVKSILLTKYNSCCFSENEKEKYALAISAKYLPPDENFFYLVKGMTLDHVLDQPNIRHQLLFVDSEAVSEIFFYGYFDEEPIHHEDNHQSDSANNNDLSDNTDDHDHPVHSSRLGVDPSCPL